MVQTRTHNMDGQKRTALSTIVLSLGFLLTAAAVLVARSKPATGYEVDIYSSTPLMFWVLALAGIAAGVAVIVGEATREKPGRIWFGAFLLLMLGNATITLLPYLRGYLYMNPADSTGHLSLARDIMEYGRFSKFNTYPINHIFIWSVARIGGTSMEAAARILPTLFTLLFMACTYLLTKVCFRQQRVAMLAAAASVLLLFYYYNLTVYPQAFGILLFPALLWTYFASRERADVGYRIALLLLVFASMFIHPAIAVTVIAYLFFVEIATLLAHLWKDHKAPDMGRVSFNLAGVAMVSFFAWISGNYLFNGQVQNFWNFFQGQLFQNKHIGGFEATVQGQGLALQDQAMILIKIFGVDIIYTVIAIAGGICAFYFLRKRKEWSIKPAVLFTIFLISGPLEVVLFLGSGTTTIGRFLGTNPIWWLTPIFVGFAFSLVLTKWGKSALVPALGSLGIIILAIFGTLRIFPSPGQLNINWQVTYSDQSILKWELEHADPKYEAIFMGLVNGTRGLVISYDGEVAAADRPSWYYTLAIGNESRLKSSQVNYTQYTSIADWDYNRSYVMLNDRFRLGSTNVALQKQGMITNFMYAAPDFEQSTFPKFNEDKELQHIYSSGGSDIYLVTRDYRDWQAEYFPAERGASF